MNKNCNRFILIIIACAISSCVVAQDLIYTPRNPAFGGNFLNYNWMLSSANAQNEFTESNEEDDLLAGFDAEFDEQILNQISRELLRSNDFFGEEGIQQGTFEFGNLQLDVVPGLNGLVITILDITTGGQTQITVPYD